MKNTKDSTKKRTNWGLIASYIFLFVLVLAYLGPLLMLVNTSLKTMPEFMKNATGITTSFNFSNFVFLLVLYLVLEVIKIRLNL